MLYWRKKYSATVIELPSSSAKRAVRGGACRTVMRREARTFANARVAGGHRRMPRQRGVRRAEARVVGVILAEVAKVAFDVLVHCERVRRLELLGAQGVRLHVALVPAAVVAEGVRLVDARERVLRQ